MKASLILRASLSFAALSAAFAAQAFSISLVSVGTFTIDATDPNLFTQDESVLASHVTPLPPLATFHADADTTNPPVMLTGTYTSGSGTLVLDFLYENTSVGGIGASTDSGTWTVTGGTGSYANLTGGGSYSISYNAGDNNFSSTTVVGDIEVVPEPASMIALSAGALALLRRRKKA